MSKSKSEFFQAKAWEIDQILAEDDQNEERERRRTEWRALSFPRKVRWIVSSPKRALSRLWERVSGKLAWYLWRRRALMRRLETERQRLKQLAGIHPAFPSNLQKDDPYLDRPAASVLDWSTRYNLHAEALKKIDPPPAPPVVTDRVAVDYQVVLGKPYLVDAEGRRIEDPVPPKPKRRRSPSSATSKRRAGGKPRR